jgi:predicted RNA-binding protein YlqC (UPF0109 family)
MDEKGLVETIVKRLVDNPSDVSINVVEGDKSTILELRVNPSDVGKVIGKGGRIVTAIRTLLFSVGIKSDRRVILEVIE